MINSCLAGIGTFLSFAVPSGNPRLAESSPTPTVRYTLTVDPARLTDVDVTIRFSNAPQSFHLAMKVHAEYDAMYWRYIDGMRITGTVDDGRAAVVRQDSTLWRVTVPGGGGLLRYRVHVQPPTGVRRAWMAFIRADGAFINTPDFFLYSPDFPGARATVDLVLPRGWRVASALSGTGATGRTAPDAAALLDSPILAGKFSEWHFAEAGTTYHVAYWPQPGATPFDTAAVVAAVHRLTRAAADIFGRAPLPTDYWFLFQDGANDALEHGASVTVGLPSAQLAHDWRSLLPEIAHEFFHTWNLVAIHPRGYNDLSYRAPQRNSGLWMGEGVTIHYADVLLRRAGLADTAGTRFDHLAGLLESYYASVGARHVPPERASLAFGDSPIDNPDATGGYYLQGELLANAIDALVRDSTRDRRGLDDVMRALFAASQHPGYQGYTAEGIESAVDAACSCRSAAFFAAQVRGTGPIDLGPALARLGKTMAVDSIPATDKSGQAAPDRRLSLDFDAPPGVVRVLVPNPATIWAAAGIRTGDVIVSFNGKAIRSIRDMQIAMMGLRVGDHVDLELHRAGNPLAVTVGVTGYPRTRVRIVDAGAVTAEQRARREAWLRGQ